MIEAVKFEKRKRMLRYGMVGGGPGSFIGGVHRKAISVDGHSILVAGCFSGIEEKNLQAGAELGIASDRLYMNYNEMAEKEAKRCEDSIDYVVIVTPNRVHYGACKAFLEKGINVVCEKPLTISLQEANELKAFAQKNDCLFCVSYTYTGYVMVKEARELIRRGDIGEIKIIMAEYPQDWLVDLVEKESRQAAWRTDPRQSGKSNCVGDIGTHIENMVSFMTGLRIKKLCANLDIIGEGRTLDTNAEILLKYDNGASGCYWCSQIAIGYDNALKVRIFGSRRTVEFNQENCNYLKVAKKGQPPQIYSRGSGYIYPEASAYSRIPAGHPEGYIEALANIYVTYTAAVHKKLEGKKVNEEEFGYPTIDMGIDGVRFIEKCVESSSKGAVWVDVE